jgi:Mg-chelatase subunit ChlD
MQPNYPTGKLQRRAVRRSNRRGAIVVLAAFMMVILFAMVAFSFDIGCITAARTEIQRAADSGALAGAGSLGDDRDAAELVAIQYVRFNHVGGEPVPTGEINVEVGKWDTEARAFLPAQEGQTAVRVQAKQPNRPTFFGRLLGHTSFDIQAEAVATYGPRDIVVVLDYSASMNDDSELKYISKLGRSAIETNLRQIYQELGSPQFGQLEWTPRYIASDNPTVVKWTLMLDSVPYPYPSGSWDDYINYVRTSDNINRAGYRKMYGYLTLVNYWLERKPTYAQTPDLWKTSEQPITAVKDAFSVFLSYIQQANTDDRVGLVVYTSADGRAKLEVSLTNSFAQVENTSRQRQAGHYDQFTNIGAGIQSARQELEDNGRKGALKMIVLMTDGIANRPGNASQAKALVRSEAQQAASEKFPIVTISLGSAADRSLMQEVADTTDGVHFNIPGGQEVAQYEEDLKEVFQKIAEERPLRLVY